MKAAEANEYAGELFGFIPINRWLTRMDAGFENWIVIPVVVGSSPISHPSVYKETPLSNR
jgi:hypothetical protein